MLHNMMCAQYWLRRLQNFLGDVLKMIVIIAITCILNKISLDFFVRLKWSRIVPDNSLVLVRRQPFIWIYGELNVRIYASLGLGKLKAPCPIPRIRLGRGIRLTTTGRRALPLAKYVHWLSNQRSSIHFGSLLFKIVLRKNRSACDFYYSSLSILTLWSSKK